jgi:hypothetical protein
MLRPELNGIRMRIKYINKPGDEIYFVDEGKARHITSRETYEAMFRDWNDIWTITFPQSQMIDFGDDISDGIPICRWGPHYYFSDGKYTRHINDPQTMAYCHLKTENIPEPSSDPAKGPFIGSPVKWEPKHNGNRVKTWNDAPVYLIDQGQKRHILDMDTLHSLFGPDERAWGADSLDDIPTGPDITSQIRLYRANDQPGVPQTFLLDNGYKRWIKSENAMQHYGFARGTVNDMSWVNLSRYADGDPIEWPADNIA